MSIADHEDPIAELRRLVEVDRAYRALRRGNAAIDDGRRAHAMLQFREAERLRHGGEVDFWRALGLARLGREEEAVTLLTAVFAALPRFRELFVRVAEVDEHAARLAEWV